MEDVNDLLRKLENAIASGDHKHAAKLAEESAKLEIQCSIRRNEPGNSNSMNIHVYIEDRLTHQGPIILKLASSMTIEQLKKKFSDTLNIPENIQRWAFNHTIIENNNVTLCDLHVTEGSTLFLHLVAPDIQMMKNNFTSRENNNNVDDSSTIEEEPVNFFGSDDGYSDDNEGESNVLHKNDEENGAKNLLEYEKLITMGNQNIAPNTDIIECPICFTQYGPLEGIKLHNCLHEFCRECLINTVKHCDTPEVKCPYGNETYACESTIQEREIKALVDPDVYQQYLMRSIIQAENVAGNEAYHCKTPNCIGWCLYDDERNHFTCPNCEKTNCLNCHAIHEGKTCVEYVIELTSPEYDYEHERRETEKIIYSMLQSGNAMICPQCGTTVEKTGGCDGLTCTRCRIDLCWATKGPRWGPNGRGDTSGGCQCKPNRRCHPDCRNCH